MEKVALFVLCGYTFVCFVLLGLMIYYNLPKFELKQEPLHRTPKMKVLIRIGKGQVPIYVPDYEN